jgi:hypothetical protein
MKNSNPIYIIILILLLPFDLFGQEVFGSYESSYFEEKFDLKFSDKDKGKFNLYISAMSFDRLADEGGINFGDKSKYEAFISTLNQAKLKYQEWVLTAKQNNVEEVSKAMSFKTRCGSHFLYGREWHFQFFVTLQYEFKILKKGDNIQYLLIIKTGQLQASDNQFMKVDGFVIVFTSETEIQDFIDALSIDKIEALKNKNKAKELFKD